MTAKRYLNTKDAAVYLGLAEPGDPESIQRGVNALYQAVHREEIPHIKWGSRLRFDIRDLDTFMLKHRREPKGEVRER